jgi:hypothetical protein
MAFQGPVFYKKAARLLRLAQITVNDPGKQHFYEENAAWNDVDQYFLSGRGHCFSFTGREE